VGPGSIAVGNEFVQLWNNSGKSAIDLPALAEELSQLRSSLKANATTPEEDLVVAEVASAELCAKENDGPRVLQHLKRAGQWALENATTIGVSIATAALKIALGL
jgi:hypothetical protein